MFRGTDIFPAEEFAARRAKVFDAIGDGVAILRARPNAAARSRSGRTTSSSISPGVVEPRALVLLDGRTRKTTLFLQPANARRDERMFGPALAPGDEAARATGVDAVLPRDEFARVAGTLGGPHHLHAVSRPRCSAASRRAIRRSWRATRQSDPWDGRRSREEVFLDKLKAAAPGAELKDLDPMLDAMRAVKSPREIALIREATRLTGLGIMEAMRDAGPAWPSTSCRRTPSSSSRRAAPSGRPTSRWSRRARTRYYSHYHRNTAVLADGDLVQFDYAPDYKYYQSDVTRVFPANGRFTPRQREFYTIYLRLYRAADDVDCGPRDAGGCRAQRCREDGRDHGVVPVHRRGDQGGRARVRGSATAPARTARGLGHNVGMEVHDVGGLQAATLEPGRIFTIEPAMRIEAERLSIRLEDMILITDTGYENLSAFVPIEIEDIERLMAQPGLSDAALQLPPR